MFEKEAKERARDFTDNEGRQVAYECGFLDGAGRATEELKEDNKVMSNNYSRMERWFYNNFAKAKEIMQNLLDVAKFYSVYRDKSALMDVTPIYEAEEFLKENEE